MTDSPVYVIEDQDVITQRLIDYFRTAQTVITDFNEGAEARNLLESVGISVYEQRFLIDYMLRMGYVHTASGDWLDGIGILVNCTRKQTIQSIGLLVITSPEAKAYDIVIPDGTLFLCSTDPTLYFESVGDQTLTAGSTTLIINGTASSGGSNGNVIAGKIDTFNTAIEDLTVNNPEPFTMGSDVEDDEAFRERILEAGKGSTTGSITWYKVEGSKVPGVHDVAVINKPLDPGYDIKLLVNGNTKPTFDSIITEVHSLFLQEDHMIGGVNVLVTSPTFINQDVNISVLLKDGYTWSVIEPVLESDIKCYFNGGTTSYGISYVGLNGGEGITLSILQMIIVNSLGTTFLDYTITSPSANVIITDEQAIMLGNINLSQIGGT
jgi:uncharacterized phage protein gp47/JayE